MAVFHCLRFIIAAVDTAHIVENATCPAVLELYGTGIITAFDLDGYHRHTDNTSDIILIG